MATASRVPGTQALRVAAVWGTTVLEVQTLERGQSFNLSDGAEGGLPIPDGLTMSSVPLRASQGGWEVDALGVDGGVLKLRGRDEDPAFVRHAPARRSPIVPGDYGLLQYGLFSIFFQYTTLPPKH